jgi:hypothetical protein
VDRGVLDRGVLDRVPAVLRPLVLVVVSLALIGVGGLELSPRSAAATTQASPAPVKVAGRLSSVPAPVRAEPQTPLTVLRATLATVVAQGSTGVALPPSTAPLVGPPLGLPAAPASPVALLLGVTGDGPSSRAPPLTTGT